MLRGAGYRLRFRGGVGVDNGGGVVVHHVVSFGANGSSCGGGCGCCGRVVVLSARLSITSAVVVAVVLNVFGCCVGDQWEVGTRLSAPEFCRCRAPRAAALRSAAPPASRHAPRATPQPPRRRLDSPNTSTSGDDTTGGEQTRRLQLCTQR